MFWAMYVEFIRSAVRVYETLSSSLYLTKLIPIENASWGSRLTIGENVINVILMVFTYANGWAWMDESGL